MCGLEGHGAFQSFPGGKLKGELKCIKHREFLAQLTGIRNQYGLDEDDVRAIFNGLPPPSSITTSTTATKSKPKTPTAGMAGAGAASTTVTAGMTLDKSG